MNIKVYLIEMFTSFFFGFAFGFILFHEGIQKQEEERSKTNFKMEGTTARTIHYLEEKAVAIFRDTGNFPKNLEELVGEQIELKFDGYGCEFKYIIPGQINPGYFDIISNGSNKRFDNGRNDDLGNWYNGCPKIWNYWETLCRIREEMGWRQPFEYVGKRKNVS